MPELPEVETIRRGLSSKIIDKKILSVIQNRANLRFDFPNDFANKLTGRIINNITRRGKYLLLHLDNGFIWLTHLGMSGRWTINDDDKTSKAIHNHLIVKFDDKTCLTYNDPRRFGFMDLFKENEKNKFLQNLGVEPLSNEFNGLSLFNLLKIRKTNIKSALLNQKNIAGLGNIYVCEALSIANISPLRPANKVNSNESEKLATAIIDVLQLALKSGGSSLKDYRNADGAMGYFQHSFKVYGKEGFACLNDNCNGIIKNITIGGRSSFYCPKHQK